MIANRVSREARLLCLVAGTGNDAEIERVVASGVDWTAAFAMAERENAFPVFWKRLAPIAARAIPREIAEQIQRRSMVAEFTLRHQERLLEDSLRALAELGIEVVLLKGAALAATVYGSFARRPMGDVDILVRPSDAQRAWDRLREGIWEWHHDHGLDEFYTTHQHLPPLFDRTRAGASMEVHTDLFIPNHPFGSFVDAVWHRAVPAKVGRSHALAPRADHLLLHACLHFAWSNALERAGWNCFRDVDALARSAQLDWGEFLRLAAEFRASSSVYWALRIAHELSVVEVPDDVLGALRPRRSKWVMATLERHFVAGLFDASLMCPSTRLRRALWEAAIQPEESGHRRARPWMRNTEYTPTTSTSRMPETDRGKRPSAWTRYLRAVVRGTAVA